MWTMNKEQKEKTKKLIKEGKHTMGDIYKAVFGTNPKDDDICGHPEACTCKVGQRFMEIKMLSFES